MSSPRSAGASTPKAEWSCDSERCVIRFFDPGRPAGPADVGVAGPFSKRSGTWEWAWGNDNDASDARANTDPVRMFGEGRGIVRVAELHWNADEVDAWEVTQYAPTDGLVQLPWRPQR